MKLGWLSLIYLLFLWVNSSKQQHNSVVFSQWLKAAAELGFTKVFKTHSDVFHCGNSNNRVLIRNITLFSAN